MGETYEGRNRRISTELERQEWKDSHPYGVICAGLLGLSIGTLAQAIGSVSPGAWADVIREAGYTLTWSAAGIYVGQRLLRFGLDRLQLRLESISATPERLDALELVIKSGFGEINARMSAREELEEQQAQAIKDRLDLLEGRGHR